MQSFDIITLRVFLAVNRLGGIGAAARSEHIAASAVSRRISDLEHDLDTVLIKRTPTGTTLTAAGTAFARHCEQLLTTYAEVRTDLKRFAVGEAGILNIAAVPRAIDGTLPGVIARFKKENPAVHITIQELFSRQGLRSLKEGMADLAVIYDTVKLKGFSVKPYKNDPVWVVGGVNHPLFEKHEKATRLFFEDTLDYDHISFHEGGVLDELVSEANRKLGRIPKYDIKVLRSNSLIKCVEAGLGLGIIGGRDLQPHLTNPNLRALPLADEWASRNLVCVYPKGQAASPTVSNFLHCLEESEAAK